MQKNFKLLLLLLLLLPGGLAELELLDSSEVKSLDQRDLLFYPLLDQSHKLIEADSSQSLGWGGAGAKVCIIDSGVWDHPSLAPVNQEWDFARGDSEAEEEPICSYHGTHIAGIIASLHPEYRGVAPESSLLMAKVFRRFDTPVGSDFCAAEGYAVSEALTWCAEQDADVISMSLGSFVTNESCDEYVDLHGVSICEPYNSLVEQGISIVVSAGNDPKGVCYPACCSRVVTVGSVNKQKELSGFSGRGEEELVDLVAPGEAIFSCCPEGFCPKWGTSMSAPHVSGALAVLKERYPAWTREDREQKLLESAEDLGYPETSQGAGLVQLLAAVKEKLRGNLNSYGSIKATVEVVA